MVQDRINADVVRDFWSQKAKSSSNRWTSSAMLDYEIALLEPFANVAESILDLGSGTGDLSRAIVGDKSTLTAVDYIPDFARAFSDSNHEFICSTVSNYTDSRRFGLILLMGVITCIDIDEEIRTYDNCAELIAANGTLVVKNQCAVEEEIVFNGVSEKLGSEYSARYPNWEEQLGHLSQRFAGVEVVRYPAELNPWPNSFHVAFICKEPR